MSKLITTLCLLLVPTLSVQAEETRGLAELLQACQQCHRHAGAATVPGWPPLTSMSEEEIAAKLRGYRDGLIPQSRMTEVAHEFSDAEIQMLAEHFGNWLPPP